VEAARHEAISSFGERDVGRRVVRVADDARVIVRATPLVPEGELLDPQDIAAQTPRQPVEGAAADASETEDDGSPVGPHRRSTPQ
jgi:hypothetical protein